MSAAIPLISEFERLLSIERFEGDPAKGLSGLNNPAINNILESAHLTQLLRSNPNNLHVEDLRIFAENLDPNLSNADYFYSENKIFRLSNHSVAGHKEKRSIAEGIEVKVETISPSDIYSALSLDYRIHLVPENDSANINCRRVSRPYVFDSSINYNGGKLVLLLDSNTRIERREGTNGNQCLNKLIRELEKKDYVNLLNVPIINLESMKGGIAGKSVDNSLTYGWEGFRNQAKNNFHNEKITSLEGIFKASDSYFSEIAAAINYEVSEDRFASPEMIAGRVMQSLMLSPNKYSNFINKIVLNCAKNNLNNVLADKVLATYNIAFNLMSDQDISIIITNDPDITAISHLFMEKILPDYIAKTAVDYLNKNKLSKHKNHDHYLDQFRHAAKEHIDFFQKQKVTPLATASLVFNYSKGLFYQTNVPSDIKKFVMNNCDYLSQMLKLMVDENKPADVAYDQLLRVSRLPNN